MTEKMFMIVAQDGRVFYSCSQSKEELLKTINIPVKEIHEMGEFICPKQTN